MLYVGAESIQKKSEKLERVLKLHSSEKNTHDRTKENLNSKTVEGLFSSKYFPIYNTVFASLFPQFHSFSFSKHRGYQEY